MKELLKEVKKYHKLDEINEDYFAKLKGDTYPGASVEIFWKDRNEPDRGYIFTLPNQTWDEADVCLHVPNPDNEDGMDEAPEVHIHIYNLLSNKRVNKIVVGKKHF